MEGARRTNPITLQQLRDVSCSSAELLLGYLEDYHWRERYESNGPTAFINIMSHIAGSIVNIAFFTFIPFSTMIFFKIILIPVIFRSAGLEMVL